MDQDLSEYFLLKVLVVNQFLLQVQQLDCSAAGLLSRFLWKLFSWTFFGQSETREDRNWQPQCDQHFKCASHTDGMSLFGFDEEANTQVDIFACVTGSLLFLLNPFVEQKILNYSRLSNLVTSILVTFCQKNEK